MEKQELPEALTKLPHRVDNSLPMWEEFKELTSKYECLSLGEGAPGSNPPDFLVEELVKAINEGHNQYTRSFGNPILVNKIAEYYGPKLGRTIDPMGEVVVGAGAYYVIIDMLMTFIDPKNEEEVVLFEPSYPCYYDHIQFAGGVVRPAPLEFKDGRWTFNAEAFRKALNPKTRVLILNNA